MKQGHKHGVGDLDEGHLYVTGEIPRFKHKAEAVGPRYSPVLAIAILTAFGLAVFNLTRAIHGLHEPDWHYLSDGFSYLALFVCVCLLWSAWGREERYPELLPRAEFERRYPTGPGSGPM